MKTFDLKGTVRKGTGKKAAKAVRTEGEVPCVLYGGSETVHFQTKSSGIRKLLYTPDIYLINLDIDGKVVSAIVKETQFHPVKDVVLHADFLEVKADEPIVISVPVQLEGLAEGVKAGGKLSLEKRKLKVKGLYKHVPERLVVNVESLGLGKTIQVGRLLFDNLTLLDAKNAVVCAVKLTRAARGAAASAAK
ncbi:MAG: 50S ribosomal protein L25/general stress protein Ctc [Bacteroidales bacterium]|jgi:large subunit ribosomal protein L25|nr:50S ribosomal protein L25/general stress protein Ctc [Bacteroidales bacterium]